LAPQTNTIFDVIIAGAGPAGTSCALALRKSGLKVALIDKAKFPRDKVCGDAIPGLAVKVLKELDPKFLDAFSKVEKKTKIYTTRFVSSYKREATKYWKNEAYNCTRFSFDAFLLNLVLKHSNIVFFPETQITNVQNYDSHIEVITGKSLFKASVVLVCDGAQSVLSKKLIQHSLNRNDYSAAVRTYVEGIEGIKEHQNEVYFSKKFKPGYFWIFPVSQSISNVGFGMLSSSISKRKIRLHTAFDEVIQEFPELKQRFSEAKYIGKLEGFGLPLGTKKLPISGSRFLLCGDAASLIDPISGDGIGNAMLSAKLAAEHIIKNIASNQLGAEINLNYDKSVYKQISKELRRNTFILRLTQILPWLPDLGVFILSKTKSKSQKKASFVQT
jgi:geranylgeranyl reductase family protein